MIKRLKFFLCLVFVTMGGLVAHAEPLSDQKIVEALKGFNVMRESLAGGIDKTQGPITAATFEQTCKPVGQALKTWGAQHTLKVRQVSHKPRNPQNSPTPEEAKAIQKFLADPALTHLTHEGSIYHRIPVVHACLHCHGEKASRPEFILKKYPNDKAFDFKVGDLRGLYHVQRAENQPVSK